MSQSIFERYGGFATVNKVVLAFYEKVLDSSIMSPYFINTDMKMLIDHQTKFIAFLMGGPASFTDEYLAQLHKRMNIDRVAFDEMVMLLTETLEDFDLSDEDIATVQQALHQRADLIISRH